MSKTAPKQEKATLEESKTNKVGFENAPKLFSKWSYDDIKVPPSLSIDWRSLFYRLYRCSFHKSPSFCAPHCWAIPKQEIQKGVVPNRRKISWLTPVPWKEYR